jgi:hypothetical protein
LAIAAALTILVGCNGETEPLTMRVWGDVTLDGKPLDEGSIVFSPAENTAGGSAGGGIKQGRYDVPSTAGLVSGGKYRVEITALRPVGKQLPNIIERGGPPLQASENYIPPTYNAKTTLAVTVSDDSSKNQFDFKLLAKASKSRR